MPAEDGYRDACILSDTPYKSVTEWRQAMLDAIPAAERCEKCEGSGSDVLLASNGGPSEVVPCWPCEGTGRRRAAIASSDQQATPDQPGEGETL